MKTCTKVTLGIGLFLFVLAGGLWPVFGWENCLVTAGARIHHHSMKVRITYWRESDGRYLGYLNEYPDHWTQGDYLADLWAQLRDLYQTFSSEEIPGIRKEAELEVA